MKNHGKEHPDATDCDDQELAFEVVKATDGLDRGEGYRPRQALAEIVAEDRWPGNLDGAAARDRRNLPSELSS